MSSLAGYLLALPFRYQMSNVLMCRNQAFPSQLLRCQAASCIVSFARTARNLAFICHVMHTILHLKKARWGQVGPIISLSIIMLHSAWNCFSPNLCSLVEWALSLNPGHQTGTYGLFCQSLPRIKEAYLPIQCSWRLRELQNDCTEKNFVLVNGTWSKDCP